MAKQQKSSKFNKKQRRAKGKKTKKVQPKWWKNNTVLMALGAVIVATFLTFSGSLNNGFTNWDDPDYVLDNPHIIELNARSMNRIFDPKVGIAANYHPLTMLSLALNYDKSNPPDKSKPEAAFSFHLFNLIFHLLCTYFVFLFVYYLNDRKPWGALLTAFLFGIHPMHVESVAWIAERKDVLYGMFFMAGLTTYVKYLKNKLDKKYLLYTALLFICSGLSKPTAVMFPIIMLLLDWYVGRGFTKDRMALIEKIPFFLFSLFIGYATYSIQSGEAVGDMDQYSFLQRICFAGYGTFMYIAKLVVPINMSTFYPYPASLNPLPPIYYASVLISAGMFGFALWATRKTKVILFGFLFYLIINALTLQFLTVGRAIMSDRYTYIPYIGIFFMLGYLLDYLLERKNTKPFDGYFKGFAGLMGVVGLVFMFLSYQQVKVWKNSETLWSNVAKIFPDDPTAYNNRGNYFYEQGKTKEALQDLDRALALDPRFFDTYISRGKIYRQTNQLDKAMQDYSKAIGIKPEDPDVYNNRGNVYFSMNKFNEAIADYNKVLQYNPNDSRALGNMGAVYARLQKWPEAMDKLNKAIRLNPGYVDAYLNRAIIFAQTQKPNEAIKDFNNHLRYKPNNPQAYFWKGQEYEKLGQNQQALNDYNRAIQLQPQFGAAYKNRAGVHRKMGNAAQAAQDEQKAQQLGAR